LGSKCDTMGSRLGEIMTLRTELCDLLGIEYPIIQGGMAWTSTAELAAAVSEGGGIGVIGAGSMPADILRQEIIKAKSLTNKNFGVNLMLMQAHIDDLVQVLLDEKVAMVTTGAGNPGKYMTDFKEAGIKVFPVVPSVALAQRLEKQGADAIIVEGTEAGGHIGELTTMVLTPQASQSVSIPVIAAGGIATGQGLVAALALGAKGVQIGTRFICSTECTVDPKVKERLINARDRDTVVTGRSTGHPARIIRNQFSKQIEILDLQNKPDEIEKLGTGSLRKAMRDGDIDHGSLMAGQISGIINEIKPAAAIIEQILKEAQETIEGLSKL